MGNRLVSTTGPRTYARTIGLAWRQIGFFFTLVLMDSDYLVSLCFYEQLYIGSVS